jgi:hypothetical protein
VISGAGEEIPGVQAQAVLLDGDSRAITSNSETVGANAWEVSSIGCSTPLLVVPMVSFSQRQRPDQHIISIPTVYRWVRFRYRSLGLA